MSNPLGVVGDTGLLTTLHFVHEIVRYATKLFTPLCSVHEIAHFITRIARENAALSSFSSNISSHPKKSLTLWNLSISANFIKAF